MQHMPDTTRGRALAVVALLALVAAVFAWTARSEAASPMEVGHPRLLIFSGTGSTQVAPDRATLHVGVQATGTSADEALDEASGRMERLIARLKREGLDADQLQTSDVSTYRDHERDDRWRASQSLAVTLDEPERAGKLLGVATEAGADTVSGPSFGLDDQRSGYDEALRRAVADARAKADAAAALTDRRVDEVISITEGTGGDVPVRATTAVMEEGARDVPIEQGTLEVSMTVEVAFSYRDA